VPTTNAPPNVEEQQQQGQEMRRLISWLAENCALEKKPEILEVGLDVPFGSQTVHLEKVAQWPLSGLKGSRLRLSVPVEHQDAVLEFLVSTRANGNVPDPAALANFATYWELVPGELITAVHASPKAAVLLAYRESSQQGILVASWPTREALEAFRALNSTNGRVPAVGDRVEVEYEGQWYLGELQYIDTWGKASVKCDVDEPGVLTIAPLHRVKLLNAVAAISPDSSETAAASAAPDTAASSATAAASTSRTSTSSPKSRAATSPRKSLPGESADRLRARLFTDEPLHIAASSSGTLGPNGPAVASGHRRTRSAM
jgi:hypothetical protein